jgi:hypothetical protein
LTPDFRDRECIIPRPESIAWYEKPGADTLSEEMNVGRN